MQFSSARLWRNAILALVLGAILVPLAPDTGAVSAGTQFSHRIDTAHAIVNAR